MAAAAKPAGLKLLEGRGNGRDSGGRVVKTTPAYKRLAPTPPDWLDGEALEEWLRVIPELERLELVKEVDAGSLAVYCQTWAVWCEAVRQVKVEGITVINEGGNGSIQHAAAPAVGIMLKAGQQLRAWASEFGFTPSAETKLAKGGPDGDADEGNPFGA